jgi:SAM-dependent methyltransferase
MKLKLVEWLACPGCGEDLILAISRAGQTATWEAHWAIGEDREEQEILEGELKCRGCSTRYPIREGIPRLLPAGAEPGPGTGHRWTEFEEAVPEFEESFRDLIQPLSEADFMGRLVLDAGCGFGRHAFFAARFGAEVVALDHSSEAIASAAKNLGDHVRVHLVQGDVLHPPFKKGVFDITYSFGVLHHLTAPKEAFLKLGETVRPGGRLCLWVYGPRQGITRIVVGALRGATAEMSASQLHNVSRVIAAGLRVFSHTPYAVLKNVPGLRSMVTHLPVHDHARWPFGVVVADVYDRLKVPVTAWFPGEQLEVWYAEGGYADISVTRRVRNNESFRSTGVKRS